MKFTKEEILNSKRIFKSATPKQDLSWYVKWTASTLLLSAMVFRAEGLFPLADLILSFTGCLGWLWVGLLWRDRALIILNSVAVVILASGLLRYLTPLLVA
mgnify:FL=1|tara:strand:+ start:153 stop:455 length:303 start_codon:yes stop_codon:yes gene_type:complete